MKTSELRNTVPGLIDEHTLNCLCRHTAEHWSVEVGASIEECVDAIKRMVLDGRLILEVHPDGKRVRLISAPAPTLQ
jgi:hypothetical protein